MVILVVISVIPMVVPVISVIPAICDTESRLHVTSHPSMEAMFMRHFRHRRIKVQYQAEYWIN